MSVTNVKGQVNVENVVKHLEGSIIKETAVMTTETRPNLDTLCVMIVVVGVTNRLKGMKVDGNRVEIVM